MHGSQSSSSQVKAVKMYVGCCKSKRTTAPGIIAPARRNTTRACPVDSDVTYDWEEEDVVQSRRWPSSCQYTLSTLNQRCGLAWPRSQRSGRSGHGNDHDAALQIHELAIRACAVPRRDLRVGVRAVSQSESQPSGQSVSQSVSQPSGQ